MKKRIIASVVCLSLFISVAAASLCAGFNLGSRLGGIAVGVLVDTYGSEINEYTVRFVDADEVVSTGLREEIEAELAKNPGDIVGYDFPRLVYYLGMWLKHGEWYPDRKLRLFRKDRGHSEGQEPHDRVVVDGPVRHLRHPLYHFTYDDMTDHIETLNRFSSISAREKNAAGQKFRIVDLLFRPVWRFFKAYFLKRGFLDGKAGFVIAGLSSFGVFIKYAKLMEMPRMTTKAALEKHGGVPESGE